MLITGCVTARPRPLEFQFRSNGARLLKPVDTFESWFLFDCCAGVSPDGDWEWGGCADNVQHGYKKSREFMDARYRKRGDLKTQVMLHNNEVGRLVSHSFHGQFFKSIQMRFFYPTKKAVKNYMRTECKCHGLSGSCTLRTCWRKMPLFRDVGNRLKEKFDGAAKVIPGELFRLFAWLLTLTGRWPNIWSKVA